MIQLYKKRGNYEINTKTIPIEPQITLSISTSGTQPYTFGCLVKNVSFFRCYQVILRIEFTYSNYVWNLISHIYCRMAATDAHSLLLCITQRKQRISRIKSSIYFQQLLIKSEISALVDIFIICFNAPVK